MCVCVYFFLSDAIKAKHLAGKRCHEKKNILGKVLIGIRECVFYKWTTKF